MGDSSRELGTTEEIPEEKALRERRNFLKTAGKVAVTAPAVALLLSMESKRASADTFVGLSGSLQDTAINPPG